MAPDIRAAGLTLVWIVGYAVDVLAVQEASPAPRCACRYTATAPEIDGRLDDACWAAAETASTGHAVGKAERAAGAAKFRLLWDDARLYFSVEVADPEVFAQHTERDEPVWEEDCVELFLMPPGADTVYYEIDINPNGAWWDSMALWLDEKDNRALRGWNPPSLTVRVARTAAGWCAEGGILFSEFVTGGYLPPWHGDTWRGNFYRIDFFEDTKCVLSAWSPTDAFHVMGSFGAVFFEDKAGEQAIRQQQAEAKAIVAGCIPSEAASLAAQLERVAMKPAAAGAFAYAPDRGWRSPKGWGRLTPEGKDRDPLPGILGTHPNGDKEPVEFSWVAEHAETVAVLGRLPEHAMKLINQGSADGTRVHIAVGAVRKATLRVRSNEWVGARLPVAKGATITLTVDPGPAGQCGCDTTLLGIYETPETH